MSDSTKLSVLIADDEPSLLVILAQYLERLGYRAVACQSAAQAEEEFSRTPQAFWLLIADATLKDSDYPRMLAGMRARNPNMAFLVCSGYPFDVDVLPEPVRARTLFVQKPFTPRMLSQAIDQLRRL